LVKFLYFGLKYKKIRTWDHIYLSLSKLFQNKTPKKAKKRSWFLFIKTRITLIIRQQAKQGASLEISLD